MMSCHARAPSRKHPLLQARPQTSQAVSGIRLLHSISPYSAARHYTQRQQAIMLPTDQRRQRIVIVTQATGARDEKDSGA
jgi:hypothetical protein